MFYSKFLLLGIFAAGNKAQLILAGDPKQLGPILRSPIAIKFGLQLSLLERLMSSQDVYERGKNDASHNVCGSNCPDRGNAVNVQNPN